MKMMRLLVLIILPLIASAAYAQKVEDLQTMSLEEILNLRVDTSASLTKIKTNQQPVDSTVITSEMIKTSGARRLDDLLEIFVPSLQFVRHSYGQNHVGIRGLLIDKDSKMRFLIDGKDMNERTQNGFMTERDLPMLSDIERIEVVRGPVASVYGPGTIAGVVAITTFSGKTFTGTEGTIKGGLVENFVSAELKHGMKIADNHSLLLYYGLTEYEGASALNAPLISGDNIHRARINVSAGDRVDPAVNKIQNDRKAYEGQLKHKLFARWTYKDLDTWFRFTKGGEKAEPRRGGTTLSYNEWNSTHYNDDVDIGYTQISVSTALKHNILSDKLTDSHQLTFDETEWARHEVTTATGLPNWKAYREDKIGYKNILNYEFNANHNAAFGLEMNSGFFGLNSRILKGGKDTENFDTSDIRNGHGWNIFTYGFFAEYNGTIIKDKLSTLVGGRVDKHPYLYGLVSPRAALIYNVTSTDVVKFVINGSNKATEENLLKKSHNRNSTPDIEKNMTLELMYDKYFTKELSFHGDIYVNNVQLIAWNNSARAQGAGADGASQRIGEMKSHGFELEGKYTSGKTRYALSHTYLKLDQFKMAAGQTGQDFATTPYGTGNSLTVWSPNETKFSFHKQQTEKFGFDSSLIFYWGYPGAVEWADYNRGLSGTGSAMSSAGGCRDMAKAAAFWNFGADYSITSAAYIRLDFYNFLGLFDKDLNKRIYGKRTAEFRSSAPATALTFSYKL